MKGLKHVYKVSDMQKHVPWTELFNDVSTETCNGNNFGSGSKEAAAAEE